jgi:hypothetical protein
VQWFKDTQYQTVGRGYSIPPGVTTPNAGAIQVAQEFTEENAFYGAFLEQQIAHRDRLFLKLQVRSDQRRRSVARWQHDVPGGVGLYDA